MGQTHKKTFSDPNDFLDEEPNEATAANSTQEP